ncbi:MAG: glucose-1-phosphate thymidylyltransferase RfbA [Candidatus Algichlamydia australiensis]|nr:glucose-1-phosphate thymidylyltransferase RfbA [Chlamydiales bacterium]
MKKNSPYKAIILAGGSGTRLYPSTLVTSKQLLPVYDKPMIYYPLSVIIQAGIREILLISSEHDLPRIQELFGDGSHLGLELSYAAQKEPNGIAEAFLIGEEFIDNTPVALVLGDNLFTGPHLKTLVQRAAQSESGATVFGYEVQDPSRYGVIAFDDQGRPKEIVEKPKNPPSRYAVTGLYFYDTNVVSIAKSLKPSPRGELEITDVNRAYLQDGNLHVTILDRGYAWLDTGTADALHKASAYVQTLQERQGIQIGCIEEEAYNMGWISDDQLLFLSGRYLGNAYGNYLQSRIKKEMLTKS